MKKIANIEGQISLFDILNQQEDINEVCGDDISEQSKAPNHGMGPPCEGCDVPQGSITCFKRRGYLWNPWDRFAKDSEGHLLRMAIEHRECKTDRLDGFEDIRNERLELVKKSDRRNGRKE